MANVSPANASDQYKQEVTALTLSAVNVDNEGAVGDGITDDTVAINNAVQVAGSGGTVIFGSGKTYLMKAHIEPKDTPSTFLSDVHLIGNACTLKRANQVSGSTATNIATGPGPTDITLGAGEGALFSVGQQVTVFNGASYDPANHRITVIAGDVLTVDADFTIAFPAGGTVVSSHKMISTGPGWAVSGFAIDGNRANQATFAKWQNQNEIHAGRNNCIVRENVISNAPGEGIVMGGNDSWCTNNHLSFIDGNGIHFTGPNANRIFVTENSILYTNLNSGNIGHENGAIAYSSMNNDILISNNYIEGSNLYAFGLMIGNTTQRGILISNNIVRNCRDVMLIGYGPSGGNTSVTLGAGELTSAVNTATVSNTGIVTTLGLYVDMVITIKGAIQPEYNGQFVISAVPDDNTFEYIFYGSTTSPATGTITVVGVDDDAKNVMISNNQIYNSGLFEISSPGAYVYDEGPDNIIVEGNMFVDSNFSIKNVARVYFVNNKWRWSIDITSSILDVLDSIDVYISDSFEGGRKGVSVQGPGCDNVRIVNCSFRNHNFRGVEFTSTLNPAGRVISVQGCSFTLDAVFSPDGGYRSIFVDAAGVSVLNNVVEHSVDRNGIIINTTTGDCVVMGNVVKGTFSAGQALQIISGVSCVVHNNYTQRVLLDQGTTTNLANNVTITS